MAVTLTRDDNGKTLLVYKYKLTHLKHQYTTDNGEQKEYTNYQTIFPSSLVDFMGNPCKVYFYINNDIIFLTSGKPDSLYNNAAANIVPHPDGTYSIKIPKELFDGINDVASIYYIVNPHGVDFMTGLSGVVTVELSRGGE